MSTGRWETPLVRVDGARDQPVLLDEAWAAPAAFDHVTPVVIEEPPGASLDTEPELTFLEAAGADPERREEILAAGLLSCGLRLLAAARHMTPPAPDLERDIWKLLVHWLAGVDLSDQADENTLRARVARDLLEAGGGGQHVRLAAGVLLGLPADHPLRDDDAARRGLLRHLRAQRAKPDPVWELLALEQLITSRLVTHRTVLRYLRRALELRNRIDDPELRQPVLAITAGYYSERALDTALPAAARRRAAARAVAVAERAVLEDGPADEDDQILLAAAYAAAGRKRDAVDAYELGLIGRDPADSEGLWRAAVESGMLLADLGELERAAARLAEALPVVEREYLLAAGDAQVSTAGESFTDVSTTLALCEARLGRPEAAFTALERGKSLRARHRAALHESPEGRRFLELERTLLAWQRGATVRFTSSRGVDPYSRADTVIISPGTADRLPADERIFQLRGELAGSLPGTVPAPPRAEDWNGRLAPDEAVVSVGTGSLGTWWGVITAASAAQGRVVASDVRREWTAERWTDLLSGSETDSWLVALLSRRDARLQRELDTLLVDVEDFLAPLAARLTELGVRRVRLVPHRWLRIVPFWAAPALARFTICIQASGAVPRPSAVPGRLDEVLAVADPTGDLWAAAAEPEIIERTVGAGGTTVRPLVRTQAVMSAVLPAATSADVLHFAGHGRTDLTDPERSALWLHHVAAHHATSAGDDPFAEMAASVKEGWREARPGLREVVVAGAGLLAEYDDGEGVVERRLEHPLGTTLWKRGGRTAELWTAEEITVGETLPRCRLAVLTACEAAGSGLTGADEATGLPAALTAAGVPTVVASMWPVEDDVAVVFADRFYRGLASRQNGRTIDVGELVDAVSDELRGMPRSDVDQILTALIERTADHPARARLRAARVRRIGGPERPFDHPVYWAAFAVFGTGLFETGMR